MTGGELAVILILTWLSGFCIGADVERRWGQNAVARKRDAENR